ncbi:Hsp33 family molecular chaperone HslO [Thiomicrorhabdus sp.]|uniref:Hsp33 family molecular chaperone HslO n=1 Tax=Thiomicrorhabdus sp. TaxID=2039724 RepID=UPI0029C98D07|nr:Hsp33 family molecular chaperone HslO [Thiomicrorhabdus sp.]
MATNSIQRFLFKEHNIRGQVIQLHDAWQEMTKDRHYPPIISQLLGQLTAVSVVMANSMKHEGKITLQVQGSGPVNLLVVEVTHDLKIRGVAKTRETITDQNTLDDLLGDGQILVTLENMQTKHHFQSYVPRDGATIAECFELFFSQSEQLPSQLWLAADEQKLGGILIQKMPDSDDKDADAWDRIIHLTGTLSDDELTTLDSETLLHRLFHEELVELFESQAVTYECPQDRQRVDDMLRSLGEAEVRKLLAEQGEIVIHNEICNVHFRYDAKAVDELFAEARSLQ